MKKIMLFCLFMWACCAGLWAQKKPLKGKDIDLKFGITGMFGQYSRFEMLGNQQLRDIAQFGLCSPSVSINTHTWLSHEVGIFMLNYRHTETEYMGQVNNPPPQPPTIVVIGGEKSLRMQVQFFYEAFFSHHWRKTRVGVGFSLRPYAEILRTVPKTSIVYPLRQLALGQTFGLSPRVSYDVSKRVFLELSFPISVFDMYILRQDVDNPILTEQQQVEYSFNSKIFPFQYAFKLALGLRLGAK